MFLLNALKDFAEGLCRGFGIFFLERNDHLERRVMMSTAFRERQ